METRVETRAIWSKINKQTNSYLFGYSKNGDDIYIEETPWQNFRCYDEILECAKNNIEYIQHAYCKELNIKETYDFFKKHYQEKNFNIKMISIETID